MESFDNMILNLYSKLELNKDNFKIILPEPILIKSGHKTIWKNIKNFLKLFNRMPDHFIDYINNESSVKVFWLSEKKSDGCIFESKMKKDYVFEIMKKYVKDKVLCKNCQNINTILIKIKELRKFKLVCNNCKSEYII